MPRRLAVRRMARGQPWWCVATVPGLAVPDGLPVVVVAIQTQRLPEDLVAELVPGETHRRLAVRASHAGLAWVAGPGPAITPLATFAGVLGDCSGVHGAEA